MAEKRSALEGLLALPEEHNLMFELGASVLSGAGAGALMRRSLAKSAARVAGGTGTRAMKPTMGWLRGGLRREFPKGVTIGGKTFNPAWRDSTLGLLAEGVGDTAGVAAAYALEPEHIRPENLGFTNMDVSNPLLGMGVTGLMAGAGTGYRALRGTKSSTELYHDTGRGWAVPATRRGIQPDRPIPGGTIVSPEYVSPVGSELAFQEHVDQAMLSADAFADSIGEESWNLLDADAYAIFSKKLRAAHPDVSPVALSVLPLLRPLTKTGKGTGKILRKVAKILGEDLPSKGDLSWLATQIKKAERRRFDNGFFYAWEMAPTTSMSMSMSIAMFGFGGRAAMKQLYANRSMMFNRMVMHEALNGAVEEGRYMNPNGRDNVAMEIHDYFWGKPKSTTPRAVFDGADANLFDDIEDLGHLRDRLLARAGSRYRVIFAPDTKLTGIEPPTVDMTPLQARMGPLLRAAKDLTGHYYHSAVLGEPAARAIRTIEGAGWVKEADSSLAMAERMLEDNLMGVKGADQFVSGGEINAMGRMEIRHQTKIPEEVLEDVLSGQFTPEIPAEILWDYLTHLRKIARNLDPGAQRHAMNEVIKGFDDVLVEGLEGYAKKLEAHGGNAEFVRSYRALNQAYKSMTNELEGVFGVEFMQQRATDALTKDNSDLAAMIVEGIYTPGRLGGGKTGFEHFAQALLPDQQWVEAGVLSQAEYEVLMNRGIGLMGRLQDDIVGYVFTQSVKSKSKIKLQRMLQAGDLDTPVTIEWDSTQVASLLGDGIHNVGKNFWDRILLAHPEETNKLLAAKLGKYLTDPRIFRPGQRADLDMMARILTTEFPDDLPFRLAIQFLAAHDAAKLLGLPIAVARAGAGTGAAAAGAAGAYGALGTLGAGVAGAATGVLGISLAIGELFKHPRILDKILQGVIQERVVKMTPHLTRTWLAKDKRAEQVRQGLESARSVPVLTGTGSDTRLSTPAIDERETRKAEVLRRFRDAGQTGDPPPQGALPSVVPGLGDQPESGVGGPGETQDIAFGMGQPDDAIGLA